MAQVNVELSEYDMLRTSKDKAEAEVRDLKEEVKKLKDNANNVVVRNRYYIPSLNYIEAARQITRILGVNGIDYLLSDIRRCQDIRKVDMFGASQIDEQLIRRFAHIIENGLKGFLNLRSSYIEDTVTTEIRGFDEFAEKIKAELELKYKGVMEQKKAELDRQLDLYDAKHLDVEKEVKKAEDSLNSRHEKEVKKLTDKLEKAEDTITDLKERLKEASKSSEEKLAEAMAKLQAAQEEVAKYAKPKKKLFGLFG